tara:strand:- start:22480 stop:24549 length:2070 start_codon:yes stop_codon:yes gene_type:complete
MTYSVKTTDNNDTITIATGEVSTKYGVALVGRNVSGYGQFFVENTIWMLENFASDTSPTARSDSALVGQHWYSTGDNTMRVYDGTVWRRQTPLIASSAPTSDLGAGTEYFDTVDNKKRIYDGSTWNDVSYPGTVTSRWSSEKGGSTYGTRFRTLYLTDTTLKKRAVAALVYVNDGTDTGYTSNETIMCIFSDYAFTVDASSLSTSYRDSDSSPVNLNAEFNDANGIGYDIKVGMNLRRAYSTTAVSLANVALQADSANGLLIGGTTVPASGFFHTGSTTIVPNSTDAVNLGSTTNRFNNLYLGSDIVIGDPTETSTINHTIQSTGNAALSVGTTNDPVRTLYVDDIHMSGNIIGFGSDTIETIGSSSNPMDTAFISNVAVNPASGTSQQNITTSGIRGLDLQDSSGTVVFDASTGTLQNIALANALTQGDGITSFSYDGSTASTTVAVDSTVVRTSGTQTIAGAKTFSAEIVSSAGLDATGQTIKWGSLSDGSITATAFVDEDNMVSNSASLIPTQQSVKSYVDNSLQSGFVSDANNTRDLGAAGNRWATIYATTFNGTATQAQYADMAEVYSADADYEPGTVVKIGGEKEITMTTEHADTEVFGVISTNPAYLMNSEAEGLPVAMTGRVPVKVIGKIKKGQRLVSSDVPGLAWAVDDAEYDVRAIIGRSLEEKADGNEGIVEAVVGVK